MPLTIDEKIAQLQAIRDQYGGDLLLLGMRDVPSLEFRKSADGGTEVYGIRHLPIAQNFDSGVAQVLGKTDEILAKLKSMHQESVETGERGTRVIQP